MASIINRRTIHKNIKNYRLEKGLTQLELAVACNISEGHVSQIERGAALPSITTLLKIARALDVEAHKFFIK